MLIKGRVEVKIDEVAVEQSRMQHGALMPLAEAIKAAAEEMENFKSLKALCERLNHALEYAGAEAVHGTKTFIAIFQIDKAKEEENANA